MRTSTHPCVPARIQASKQLYNPQHIHDVFPANDDDNGNNPISEKKLKQLEAQYATLKTQLGFHFDGITKTMWLELAKRQKLLTILRGWIRTGHRGTAGIQFK
jgi:hypothetical protein